MRLPSSNASMSKISSAHAKSLRKQALLARAAADRAVFSKACAELSRSKYAAGIHHFLAQPLLGNSSLKWTIGWQLARVTAPFLLSKYVRAILFKGGVKRAWPLLKWGVIGVAVWKGVTLCTKMLK